MTTAVYFLGTADGFLFCFMAFFLLLILFMKEGFRFASLKNISLNDTHFKGSSEFGNVWFWWVFLIHNLCFWFLKLIGISSNWMFFGDADDRLLRWDEKRWFIWILLQPQGLLKCSFMFFSHYLWNQNLSKNVK